MRPLTLICALPRGPLAPSSASAVYLFELAGLLAASPHMPMCG